MPVQIFAGQFDDILQLIRSEKLDLVRGDGHPNPHIKAHKADTANVQIEKINEHGFGQGCLYPTPEYLESIILKENFKAAPFRYDLACGKPSLEHASFDVRALEYYKNDPRFYYRISDSHGSIYVGDETNVPAGSKDDILLDRFGFGFKQDKSRIIAVYYWDLLKLDSAQQMHWKSFQIEEETKLHPAYVRTSIMGQFPNTISVYEAIIQEMCFINTLCEELDMLPIFKKLFLEDNRPREFHFLIRPTMKDFHAFVSLFDKMLSENINSKILKKENREVRTKNKRGEIIISYKATLTILEEWLGQTYNFRDIEAPKEIVSSLRKVRKIRQLPAHKISENDHDNDYFRQQVEILTDVFHSLNAIRKILESHPKVKAFELPSWYDEDSIIICPHPD